MRPTTMVSGSHQSPVFSMASTSNPASVNRSASCCIVRFWLKFSFKNNIGTKIFYILLSHSFQQPYIVAVEVADIVDTVLLQGHAFGTHAEGETAELGGIIAVVLQHERGNHAC